MCGIVGYTGSRDAAGVVLDGLAHLAYRGYDSAGIAVADDAGNVHLRKAAGKLDNLLQLAGSAPVSGRHAIGHTRWATHGPPTAVNAHPHADGAGEIVVVHNGIVENYAELKGRLAANGHRFLSETDSEVIPHLIQELLADGAPFEEAARLAAGRIHGAHAIACMYAKEPGLIVAARRGNAGGIAIGAGAGEAFVASDLPALIPHTSRVLFMEPEEVAVVRPEGFELRTMEGRRASRSVHYVEIPRSILERGAYKHFTLKEIHEQPDAAQRALHERIAFESNEVALSELPLSAAEMKGLNRVLFVGMGTSLHAGQVGARYVETLARTPASAEVAAEFSHRDAAVDERTLVVGITQSGETADTLQALRAARAQGARTAAVTNAPGSEATRAAECALLMHAGAEVGVASTKTMVSSMVTAYLIACALGQGRGTLAGERAAKRVDDVARLPALLGASLEMADASVDAVAQRYAKSRAFLFIGRGLLEPIAREGALKMKETSYIHADGLSAAEMKHGPIALIGDDTPAVALALRNSLYPKMLNAIAQIRARGGSVIAVAAEGSKEITELADDVIWTPEAPALLQPIVATVPAQLLAYCIADLLGNDIDQPRNLAKSVTVE